MATGVFRKIVGHFSHSWKKRVALKMAQVEENLPDHVMVMDCQTRWGSTQKMVKRVLEQQPALHKVLFRPQNTPPAAHMAGPGLGPRICGQGTQLTPEINRCPVW